MTLDLSDQGSFFLDLVEMNIGNQILFFLAGLGVFNGILLVLYLFFILKPKKTLNLLFGALMLLLCIRVGKSVLHEFTDLARIYRQIGLSACILIGPLLYVYVRSALAQTNAMNKFVWVHLLVPSTAVLLVGLVWPYESHPATWNHQIVKGIYGVWFIYMIATSIVVIPLLKKLWNKRALILEKWLLLVYFSTLLLCVAYITVYYGYGLPYVAGPILFSVIFYTLIGFLLSKKNRSVILHPEEKKYRKQRINNEKAEKLLTRLSNAMQQQQLFLDPKIKLATLADAIQATPHEVSQVINDRLGISFNHYINEYRVKAACKMLENNDHLTVEGIGHEVGFNSRSAFYTAFKASMKQSPAQFKAQLKTES